MIWFKHPNDLPNDKRLASLIDNEGCRGYGMYLRIIEMLCAQPDRKLSFSQLNIISRKGFSRKYMEKIIWEYKLFTIHEEEFESAINFNNMEQMQAIIKAAVETKSPVILQVSKGARQYANATLLRYMAQGAVEYAKELGCAKPEIVLHLDHGDTFETCKSCIDSGFSSVMIDGSHLPYEENVALTKKVVDYAHQFDVTVEGELGVLAGVEDEVSSDHHTYTDPEEVIDFATRTGCDSLAISIGTSHGAYKFTPEQCHIDPATGRMVPPPLAFEVLDAVMEKLPGFPIVLHGSSSVPQEEVETINKYGGALKAAIGIPEEELRKAAKSAVCKINIDSDSRLAMTAAIRQTFAEKPAEFDPRKYLGPARDNMEKLYKHKIINVLGSDNKLAE